MITRIEISGFKTFTDFAVDLAPFTVIAGANASGKSNLLDALRFLRELATKSHTSSIKARGGILQAFTKYGADVTSDTIKIKADLLLPPAVNGVESLKYNRFSYEVALKLYVGHEDIDAFEIISEKLSTIPTKSDKWSDKYLTLNQRREYLIPNDGEPVILIHNFSTNNINEDGTYQFGNFSGSLYWTVLSETTQSDDKHLRATYEAINSIDLLSLNDSRHFSNYYNGSREPSNGSPILRQIQHIKRTSGEMRYLSHRVNQVIRDISNVDLYTDDFQRSTVTATDVLGGRYVADLLSEGTLRVIALAALVMQTNSGQSFLIEEPENGVDPRVLSKLLELLIEITSRTTNSKRGIDQVICTTHSPTLLQSALNQQKDRSGILVLLATKVTYLTTINGQRRKLPTTRMNEVVISASEDNSAEPLTRYTLRQAMDYLNRLQLPDSLLKTAPDA